MKFFFSLISVFGVLFFWQVLYDGFVGLGPSWFVVCVGIFCDQGVFIGFGLEFVFSQIGGDIVFGFFIRVFDYWVMDWNGHCG